MANAYGFADLERRVPMSTDRIFRVASHSKMFTATAILQLVEAGRVRLDDRLGAMTYRAFRRRWAGRRSARPSTIPRALFVTVRRPTIGSCSMFSRTLLSCARSLKASSLPTTTTSTSNIGYSLLGLVVEAASGRPYNEYLKESIVDRLGLQSTGPEIDATAEERLVTGYTGRHFPLLRLSIPNIGTGAMSAATGFYSTASDLLSFAAAHFLAERSSPTTPSARCSSRTGRQVRQTRMTALASASRTWAIAA